jgi:hypothetical protein
MPHKFVVLIAAAAALSSAAVAANIARSRAAGPYQVPYLTTADFDQAFKAAGAEVVWAKPDAEELRRAGLRRIDLTR